MLHNMSVVDDLRECDGDLQQVTETERGQLIKARIGQGRFREALLQHWRGCAITGVDRTDLVRASHIKPWRLSNNEERLNPFNGLLLLPQYDHLFDAGYITFDNDGVLKRSVAIANLEETTLGIEANARLRNITDEHRLFLTFHREHLFARKTV